MKIRNLMTILGQAPKVSLQKDVMDTMMEFTKVIISLAREVPRVKEDLHYQPQNFDLNAKKVSIIADRNSKNSPNASQLFKQHMLVVYKICSGLESKKNGR